MGAASLPRHVAVVTAALMSWGCCLRGLAVHDDDSARNAHRGRRQREEQTLQHPGAEAIYETWLR